MSRIINNIYDLIKSVVLTKEDLTNIYEFVKELVDLRQEDISYEGEASSYQGEEGINEYDSEDLDVNDDLQSIWGNEGDEEYNVDVEDEKTEHFNNESSSSSSSSSSSIDLPELPQEKIIYENGKEIIDLTDE